MTGRRNDEVVPTHFDFSYSGPSPTCLAAPNCKVLYFEVPKVASSALKLLLSEANGTYNPQARFKTLTANTSIEQTAHNVDVTGLIPIFDLPDDVREEALTSPEWWRVGPTRDPYNRFYSGWENRILLMPPARRLERIARLDVEDVLKDGCIDATATFWKFARDVAAHPNKFRLDGHFNTQKFTLRPDIIDFTHRFRVDVAGEIGAFATQLSERVGRPLELQRLNESIGLRASDFLTAEVGRIVEDVFADDFDAFGFEKRSFPESLPEVVLSPIETNLVLQYRALCERLSTVSRSGLATHRWAQREHADATHLRKELEKRAGGKYALTELAKVPIARLRWLLGRR